ncbi:amidohydrolase family protein [Steroidobacter flavus]|uniref:Amidohydrolase family protein n=1 Tax=Steroidobacter flavus TaxID=1842136 RepID=A0ABV8T4T4_9GAMM
MIRSAQAAMWVAFCLWIALAPARAEPTREISFTTTEGTWISLDVSPDGRTIVFDLLGDLYTLPVEGGQATALTRGIPYDTQPRFSPDGREIVFVSDSSGSENVWLMNVDGTNARKLTSETMAHFVSPSFTQNGKEILVSRHKPFTYQSSFELWLYHRDGGHGVTLVRSQPTPGMSMDSWNNAMGAIASGDGRYIYYSFARGFLANFSYEAGLPRAMPYWQVRRRDRRTGEEVDVTAAAGSGMRPVLSPDGRNLVYGTRNRASTNLMIRDLRTGDERLLIAGVQRDDQESSKPDHDLLPGYAFTPDGKRLITAYDGKIHSVDVVRGEARVIPMSVPVSREIGPALQTQSRVPQGPVVARIVQRPTLSPDGKSLAFTAFGQLYVKSLPSGEPKPLTSGSRGGYQPAWSADGRWIVYTTWTSTEGGALWKIRASGSGRAIRLTNDAAYYRDPVWSPDGTRVLAMRMSKSDFSKGAADMSLAGIDEHAEEASESGVSLGASAAMDLAWVPADSGDTHVIVSAPGLMRPHFGPENDRVYLSSGLGLVSMRLDGSDRRAVLELKTSVMGSGSGGMEMQPMVLLSPDGQQVLAHVRGRVYAFPMAWTGVAPLTIDVSAAQVPMRRLDQQGGDDIAWNKSGTTALWTLGATVFRAPVNVEAAVESDALALRIEKPRAQPRGAVVLSGARVITMKADEVIEDADVLVVDNRISAIGPRGALQLPAKVTRVDVAGKTLVPGFIDLHPHMLALRRGVLELQAWPFQNYLSYGVTTGRDPQTMNVDPLVHEDLVEAGEVLGYRSFSTGPGAFPTNDIQSLEDALRVVRRYRDFYGVRTIKSYLIGNRQQRQWIIEAARHLNVMLTTEGGGDLVLDITHALDGMQGNEHVLPYTLHDDVIQLFSRTGIVYTPAILETYGGPSGWSPGYQNPSLYDDEKLRRFYPPDGLSRKRRSQWIPPEERFTSQLAQSAVAVARAGGRVCVGSHGNFAGLGYHWNLWAYADGGLTALEALRAATMCGAEALGYSQDLGSIEPGKLADILVLDQNPLDDIRHTESIRYVMKNGVLYRGDTLEEQWPTQRPAPPLWWH